MNIYVKIARFHPKCKAALEKFKINKGIMFTMFECSNGSMSQVESSLLNLIF